MATRDRIYVSSRPAVQQIYDALKEERGESHGVVTKPFRFDREIFLAAMMLGFKKSLFAELPGNERKERFQWGTLINDSNALPAMRAIALLHESDPSILDDDNRVANIAEGYANGGIAELGKVCEGDQDELMMAIMYVLSESPSLAKKSNE
jgi:hypothetical protein